MSSILAAMLGALVTVAVGAIVGPLILAFNEVNRRDYEVEQRDQDLEEWVVVRDRQLKQRWNEIQQAANEAGTMEGGTIPAGRAAAQTMLLYDYREELRKAQGFVLRLNVDEQWTHRLVRKLKRQPFRKLAVPERAGPLIDYWAEGTARTALNWNLASILKELPDRATSRARA